jgi:hypothetical protein
MKMNRAMKTLLVAVVLALSLFVASGTASAYDLGLSWEQVPIAPDPIGISWEL